jgi:hypothetical protein
VTIIPLAPVSRPRSSDLPEGESFRAGLRRTEGSLFLRTNSVSRASSPLLFGLAPRGVCLASAIAAGAVGSYPTFSPLPSLRTSRRHPEGFPPGYHRDTLRWRFILCGTVRDSAAPCRVQPGTTRRSVKFCLTAKPACWLPGVTRRVALYPEPCGLWVLSVPVAPGLPRPLHSQSGVRTFLPPSLLS